MSVDEHRDYNQVETNTRSCMNLSLQLSKLKTENKWELLDMVTWGTEAFLRTIYYLTI